MSLDQTSGIVHASNASTADYSYPSAPASGSAGIAMIGGWVANPALGGINTAGDNRSNSWVERLELTKATVGGSGVWVSVWTGTLTTVTHPVTFSAFFNSGAAYTEGVAVSWTSEVVFDVKGEDDGGSITSGSHPSTTTDTGTASDGVRFACASTTEDSVPLSGVGWTEPSAWTNFARHESQQDTCAFDANYKTFSGDSGAKTATWQSHTSQAAGCWAAGIIIMKASGGADSPLSGQASTGAQTTPTKTLSVAL